MWKQYLHPTWIAFLLNALDMRLFSTNEEIVGPLRCFPSLCITLAATIFIIYGGIFDCILPRAIPWPLCVIMQFIFSALFLELATCHFWIPFEISVTEGIGRFSQTIDENCRVEDGGPWCWLATITTYFSDECLLGLLTYIFAITFLLTAMHGTMLIDLRLSKSCSQRLFRRIKNWIKKPKKSEDSCCDG